jgi:1-acyl-sn-glycerol-3-phosphate acyltransferase
LGVYFLILCGISILTSPFLQKDKYNRRIAKFLTPIGFPLFGLTYELEGEENLKDKQYIVIANHQSFFDTVIASVILPIIPSNIVAIGKKSLGWMPVFGYYFKVIF